MNTLFPQYKKILADPGLLKLFVAVLFVLIGAAYNFCIHLILMTIDVMRNLGLTQIRHLGSLVTQNLKQNWFLYLLPGTSDFWIWACLAFWLIFALVIWRKIYNMRVAFKDLNMGSDGTARFTTQEELEEQYLKVSLDKNTEYKGHAGLPVAWTADRQHVYIDQTPTNASVLGGTQTGKTQSVTYPTIDLNLRAEIPDSMVINDIKGDLLRNTYFHPLIKKKCHLRAFNLSQPKNGLRYNPLYEIKAAYFAKKIGLAQEKAAALAYMLYNNPDAKEPVWDEGAMAIFEALSLLISRFAYEYHQPKWANMTALIDLIDYTTSEKDEHGKSSLDYYLLSLKTSDPVRRAYSIALKAEKRQTTSFYMMVAAKLKYFFTEDMMAMTSDQDMDFNDLPFPKDGKPTLLFVVFPYADFSKTKILKMFYTQMYQKWAESTTLGEGKFDVRVRSWIEEFQNIPEIDGLSRYANVGLASGMMFGFVYQSKKAVLDTYNENMAESILGAAGNQYYIKTEVTSEAEEFSKSLGDATIIKVQRSGDPLDTDKSYTEAENGRNLFKPDELMRLIQGEYVLSRNKYTRNLKNKPIRPYPIAGLYKEVHDAKTGRVSFEEDTNARFAYEYLFEAAGGDFGSRGHSLSDLELRVNLEIDKTTGQPIDRQINYEDLIIPHCLIDNIFAMAIQYRHGNLDVTDTESQLAYQAARDLNDKYRQALMKGEKLEDVSVNTNTNVNTNASGNVVGFQTQGAKADAQTQAAQDRAQAEKERNDRLMAENLGTIQPLTEATDHLIADHFGDDYEALLTLVEKYYGPAQAVYVGNPLTSFSQFKDWVEKARGSKKYVAFAKDYNEKFGDVFERLTYE